MYQIEVVVANCLPTGTRLHVLITSRSGIPDIEHSIKADIQVGIRSNENDVRLYLQNALRDQDLLSDWILESPEFEASIIRAILPAGTCSRTRGGILTATPYLHVMSVASSPQR